MKQQRYRILVVDDMADWRKTLSGLLDDAGYHVRVAASPAQAVSLLRAGRFDLALVDIRLDESDDNNTEGIRLAAEIRQRWPATKVLMITGYSTPEAVKQALGPSAQGAKAVEGCLLKPRTEELVKAVQRVLAA